jgi:hypothetical protein
VVEYRVYGLKLRASRALPHLLPARNGFDGDQPDVRVDVGEDQPQPPFDQAHHCIHLRYATPSDALEFTITPDGGHIWTDWTSAAPVASIEDVSGLLLGPVLGCALRLRGTISLHGCAVAIGSRAAVILADHGGGKSTLAAALAQAGHQILSDDLAAITEGPDGWMVHAGYPRLRLRSDAIAAMGLSESSLPRVFTGQDKRYVGLAALDEQGWRFASEGTPLGAIYALRPRRGSGAPQLERLRGTDRLTALLTHRSASYAVIRERRQARELASLARLASDIPVCTVGCPEGLAHLPALRDAILNDVALHR